ncbi:hypothetical protein ED28_00175 [[Pantoea] beijingensis]|uniref:Pentapeptide MXKDX repeat protein n=1 Tax=[Pantoea] beijingensis TaxID=1324864 RepID=A0A443IH87_9GAMM|nr:MULTISPECIES: hypothetical protein [Erwiniaceae]RWR03438.1 hypothetical protein ED28_00175 [[Pantoea] beijingensis]
MNKYAMLAVSAACLLGLVGISYAAVTVPQTSSGATSKGCLQKEGMNKCAGDKERAPQGMMMKSAGHSGSMMMMQSEPRPGSMMMKKSDTQKADTGQ